MTEQVRTSATSEPNRVTLQDRRTGRLVQMSARTKCVSAGPRYRARDLDGTIAESAIERDDFVELADTVLGALVYVQERGEGFAPRPYRLFEVVQGRPSRVARTSRP
jgi:hypothetical protein